MTEQTTPDTSAAATPTAPELDHSQVILRLHAARVVASEKQPYLSTALFAMVPVKVANLGTLASDAKWRLYYDPAKVLEWPVEELAGVLLHEVGHCLRGHADRFTAIGENAKYAPLFNIAGDSLINADLRDDRISLPGQAVYLDTLAEQGIPATREMSAEQVYTLLREKSDKESCTCGTDDTPTPKPANQAREANPGAADTENGSDGGQQNPAQTKTGEQDSTNSPEGAGASEPDNETSPGNQPDPNCPVHGNEPAITGWDCGSAADGIRRDYETEGDKVDAGIDEDRADLIRQQVAVEITNHAKNRGTVPGGYTRWAQELLDPTVDWRRELASLVRRSFAQIAGLRDYTYRRPSRRDSSMRLSGQNIVLPAMRQPNPPKIAIVIDTSGSMTDDMLTWALSETQGVLRSLGSAGRAVRLISCDAKATSTRIRKASDVTLTGGGGTDMRVGIDEAMTSRDRPDVVIVLTDGYTPWPSEPLRGSTLIVALTDGGSARAVPTWARTVLIARS
jgi:predicted metal-dependent peptidase